MSDTPEIEMRLSRSSDLAWLNPFSERRVRNKKRMNTVTLRLTDDQLARYKALGGALGVRKFLAGDNLGEPPRSNDLNLNPAAPQEGGGVRDADGSKT
jgi:hypothetical protein